MFQESPKEGLVETEEVHKRLAAYSLPSHMPTLLISDGSNLWYAIRFATAVLFFQDRVSKTAHNCGDLHSVRIFHLTHL